MVYQIKCAKSAISAISPLLMCRLIDRGRTGPVNLRAETRCGEVARTYPSIVQRPCRLAWDGLRPVSSGAVFSRRRYSCDSVKEHAACGFQYRRRTPQHSPTTCSEYGTDIRYRPRTALDKLTIGVDPVSTSGLEAQIEAARGLELRGVPAGKGNSDVGSNYKWGNSHPLGSFRRECRKKYHSDQCLASLFVVGAHGRGRSRSPDWRF
jgi:hypothetical protein